MKPTWRNIDEFNRRYQENLAALGNPRIRGLKSIAYMRTRYPRMARKAPFAVVEPSVLPKTRLSNYGVQGPLGRISVKSKGITAFPVDFLGEVPAGNKVSASAISKRAAAPLAIHELKHAADVRHGRGPGLMSEMDAMGSKFAFTLQPTFKNLKRWYRKSRTFEGRAVSMQRHAAGEQVKATAMTAAKKLMRVLRMAK